MENANVGGWVLRLMSSLRIYWLHILWQVSRSVGNWLSNNCDGVKFLRKFDCNAIAAATNDPKILFVIVDNPRGMSSRRGPNVFNPVKDWHLVCAVKNPSDEDCPLYAPAFLVRLDEKHAVFKELSRGMEGCVRLDAQGRTRACSMNLLIYKRALAGSETYGKLMINLCGGQTKVGLFMKVMSSTGYLWA